MSNLTNSIKQMGSIRKVSRLGPAHGFVVGYQSLELQNRTAPPRRMAVLRESLLGFLHIFVDLIEVLDGEEALVKLVYLDGRREDFIQIEIPDFAALFNHVGALLVRANDAAAVHL